MDPSYRDKCAWNYYHIALSAQIAIETERNTLPSTYLLCAAAVNTLSHTHMVMHAVIPNGDRCLTSQPSRLTCPPEASGRVTRSQHMRDGSLGPDVRASSALR